MYTFLHTLNMILGYIPDEVRLLMWPFLRVIAFIYQVPLFEDGTLDL